MTNKVKIDVRKLSPELLKDFLSFFDTNAFADNPNWSFCYCYFNQFPHDDMIWKEQEASDNRNSVCELIKTKKMNGYLAYHEEKVIGWCNAGPRTCMTTVPEYPEPDANSIGSIVCFIIDKKYRSKGIAKKLLQSAYSGLFQQGYSIVEAYPLKNMQGEKENHFGPLSMYLSSGFQLYKEDEDTIVVRKIIH